MEVKTHTDRAYEAELAQLRDRLLLMGGRVEEMIARSVRAFHQGDAALARAVIADDARVNRAEIEVDDLCMRLLARRQPVASDLRFITFSLKMVTDLERIGDLAVNICERAIDLAAARDAEPPPAIAEMAAAAQGMVRDAIDAFVARDADRARAVLGRDDAVDALYHQVFRDLVARMQSPGADVDRCLRVQYVAKYLERIGDHATNLAEQVIFMVQGQDVRHRGRQV